MEQQQVEVVDDADRQGCQNGDAECPTTITEQCDTASAADAPTAMSITRHVNGLRFSCGTPLAARINCACSDGVNGRQLTISLRLFSIPTYPTLGQT